MSTDTIEMSPALIGRGPSSARSGERIDAMNPATGECIGSFPRCTEEDVELAVVAAKAAFKQWRKTHPQDRANMLLALADAVEADREHLLYLDVNA